MSEHFDDLCRRFLRRRTFLKAAAAASSAAVFPVIAEKKTAADPGFTPLANALTADHAVADGYIASVLLRWGDSLGGTAPAKFPLSVDEQRSSFGFNNDFIAYVPLQGSQRGLLCVNNEYPQGHLMFPGYPDEVSSRESLDRTHTAGAMAAVGHSVFEIRRGPEGWSVVPRSPYQRRIHAHTPIHIGGPAAGHESLRTAADPSGTRVLGTLGCCSGGKTPWGTVLIAEENVGDYFSFASAEDEARDSLVQTDPEELYRGWAALDERFDLSQAPNELRRFGWIVEFGPRDPQSVPVKHTALGRFEHEGATVVAEEGRPLVVYSGDDSVNEHLYRFVSEEPYEAERGAENSRLFSAGTLYCARFSDDGTGQWLPLVFGEGSLVPANGFRSQAEVLINARRAAALLGATPMDRPEGIAVSPRSGRVYAAMTKNKKKPSANAANPRASNAAGHIVELIPPVRRGIADHWADTFRWDLLLQGGDPAGSGDAQGKYAVMPLENAWLTNPDNLIFGPADRLWIATDGMDDFGFCDGLWCTSVDGAERSIPALFYRCPRGAELCGPEFTPDGSTLFVAVQHPGKEEGSNFDRPSTRWPDFDPNNPPRPAVVAITRKDGGTIGA